MRCFAFSMLLENLLKPFEYSFAYHLPGLTRLLSFSSSSPSSSATYLIYSYSLYVRRRDGTFCKINWQFSCIHILVDFFFHYCVIWRGYQRLREEKYIKRIERINEVGRQWLWSVSFVESKLKEYFILWKKKLKWKKNYAVAYVKWKLKTQLT